MPSVFINYRTSDSLPTATLLDRELSARFGSQEIFRAGKSIEIGERFSEEIHRALRKCDVLLALIGPTWRDARNRHGRRALDQEDDWVRVEILKAFEYNLLVIPVHLDHTPRLVSADVPEALARLTELHAVTLNHRDPDEGFDRIAKAIVRVVPALGGKPGPQRGRENGSRADASAFRGNLFLGSTTVDGDAVGGDKHVWGAGERNG